MRHRYRRFARRDDLELTEREFVSLHRLTTPQKIQAFVDAVPINHEYSGETVLSVREVLRQKRAHCIEGALLAACAFWVHGERPLVMHLDCALSDYPHLVALFRRRGCWGAISKTNHLPLRYRDPSIARCASSPCRIFTSTATGAVSKRCARTRVRSICAASTRKAGLPTTNRVGRRTTAWPQRGTTRSSRSGRNVC
jgi:hypothetical protein